PADTADRFVGACACRGSIDCVRRAVVCCEVSPPYPNGAPCVRGRVVERPPLVHRVPNGKRRHVNTGIAELGYPREKGFEGLSSRWTIFPERRAVFSSARLRPSAVLYRSGFLYCSHFAHVLFS